MKNINPFLDSEKLHFDGLNQIGKELGPNAKVPDLIEAVFKYVTEVYFDKKVPKQTEVDLKSVISFAINGYLNSTVQWGNTKYSVEQYYFIRSLISNTMSLPPLSIKDYILDVEENIINGDLSPSEQSPLLLTTAIGKSDFDYWAARIENPDPWNNYFPKPYEVMSYFSHYVIASMIGTLTVANSTKFLDVETDRDTNIGDANFIAGLAGSLAVAAGKVIFKWIPKINNNDFAITMMLNRGEVARLDSFDPVVSGSPNARGGITSNGYCCPTHKGGTCGCPNTIDNCPNHPCGSTGTTKASS